MRADAKGRRDDGAQYPIKTRQETENGWIMTIDYGPKLGVGTLIVEYVPRTPEERAQDRAQLNAFLKTKGYRLAETEST